MFNLLSIQTKFTGGLCALCEERSLAILLFAASEARCSHRAQLGMTSLIKLTRKAVIPHLNFH